MLIKSQSLPILALVVVSFGQLMVSIIHGFFISAIPISLTIYIFAITLLAIYISHNNFIIYKNRVVLFDLVVFMFVIMIVISYLSSPAIYAANSKLLSTWYLIFIPSTIMIFGCLSIKEKKPDLLISIAKNISLASIFIAGPMFYFGFSIEAGRDFTIIGIENSIWFGRYVGITLLILLLTFNGNLNIYYKHLHIYIIILAIILLYKAGARGPILGVLVAVALLRLKRTMIVMISLGMLFLLISNEMKISFNLEAILLSMNDFSSIVRISHYQYVINQFLDIPLWGYGYGSYGLLYLGDDVVFHPHNLLLEVLFEMGLISLLLLIYMIASSLKQARNSEILKGSLIFMLINSMVSGDIPGNFGLFVMMMFIRYWTSIAQAPSVNRMQIPQKNKRLV